RAKEDLESQVRGFQGRAAARSRRVPGSPAPGAPEPAGPGRGTRGAPWGMRTPATSRTAPASSAGPGASPSSAHALAIATTGASSTQGTTCPDGYRDRSRLKIADP